VTCHISDNDGEIDRHWLPGNGVIDWRNFWNLFPKESYLKNIMLEVLPTDDEKKAGPEQFLIKAFKSISSLANN